MDKYSGFGVITLKYVTQSRVSSQILNACAYQLMTLSISPVIANKNGRCDMSKWLVAIEMSSRATCIGERRKMKPCFVL